MSLLAYFLLAGNFLCIFSLRNLASSINASSNFSKNPMGSSDRCTLNTMTWQFLLYHPEHIFYENLMSAHISTIVILEAIDSQTSLCFCTMQSICRNKNVLSSSESDLVTKEENDKKCFNNSIHKEVAGNKHDYYY